MLTSHVNADRFSHPGRSRTCSRSSICRGAEPGRGCQCLRRTCLFCLFGSRPSLGTTNGMKMRSCVIFTGYHTGYWSVIQWWMKMTQSLVYYNVQKPCANIRQAVHHSFQTGRRHCGSKYLFRLILISSCFVIHIMNPHLTDQTPVVSESGVPPLLFLAHWFPLQLHPEVFITVTQTLNKLDCDETTTTLLLWKLNYP